MPKAIAGKNKWRASKNLAKKLKRKQGQDDHSAKKKPLTFLQVAAQGEGSRLPLEAMLHSAPGYSGMPDGGKSYKFLKGAVSERWDRLDSLGYRLIPDDNLR